MCLPTAANLRKAALEDSTHKSAFKIKGIHIAQIHFIDALVMAFSLHLPSRGYCGVTRTPPTGVDAYLQKS